MEYITHYKRQRVLEENSIFHLQYNTFPLRHATKRSRSLEYTNHQPVVSITFFLPTLRRPHAPFALYWSRRTASTEPQRDPISNVSVSVECSRALTSASPTAPTPPLQQVHVHMTQCSVQSVLAHDTRLRDDSPPHNREASERSSIYAGRVFARQPRARKTT